MLVITRKPQPATGAVTLPKQDGPSRRLPGVGRSVLGLLVLWTRGDGAVASNSRRVDAADWATVVSAAAAAAAAMSARSSARASNNAVRRSHMPFVWPSYNIDYGEQEPMTGMQTNTVRASAPRATATRTSRVGNSRDQM